MFHIHKWGKWSEAANYIETWHYRYAPSRTYEERVLAQYRTCTRCGCVKFRKV